MDRADGKVAVIQKPQNPDGTYLFLDLAQTSFLAGQNIEGVVVLVVQKPLQVSRLSLVWKGLEHVSWYEGLTAGQHVTATEWWIAKRLNILPDDGTSAGNQTLAPSTYTFPFSVPLPAELPNSIPEDQQTQIPDLNLSEQFTPTINIPDKSCLRYSVTATLETLQGGTTVKQSTFKDFDIVESFDTSIFFKPAAVRKVQKNFLLGGPLTGLIWVANQANLLVGHPLHIKVDIFNKSPVSVEKVTLSLWEHKTLSGNGVNQSKKLKSSRSIQDVLVSDSNVPSGTQKSKTVKFVPRITAPTTRRAKLHSISYELVARYELLVDSLEIRVPLNIYGVCKQLVTAMGPVPINLTNDQASELHERQLQEVEAGFVTY